MIFYKISFGSILNICKEIELHEKHVTIEMLKISRKFGASRTRYVCNKNQGDLEPVGLIFKNSNKVDQKLFKQHKIDKEIWIPRAGIKAGKELLNKFRSFKKDHYSKLCDLINFKHVGINSTGHPCWRYPKCQKIMDTWIIAVPHDSPIKGIRGVKRISDIEYENLINKHNKSLKNSA